MPKRKFFYWLTISNFLYIIVLLILAGITIAALSGDNGILTRASESKEKTEEAQEKEGIELAITSSQMEDVNTLEITEEKLSDAIKQQFGNNKDFSVTDNEDGSFLVKMNDTKRMYYIDKTGEIIEQSNMLKISTAEELKTFRDDVNKGNTYEGWYIYMTNNITLDNEEEWTPIGKYDSTSTNPDDEVNKCFMGIFDGKFHKISNLNINSTEKGKGLFAIIKQATIKNLGIDSGNISSSSSIGGIVGYAYNNAKIINCYNNATITGGDRYVGGIVGYARINVSIENCYNSGTIIGKYNAGGISGEINDSKILNCYNIGNINATETPIGGISGVIINNSSIINSYNTGNITTTKNSNKVGAIIGYLKESIAENCYFLENIVNESNGNIIIEGTTPTTSEELKKLHSILGTSFKEDTNNINNGYPIFQWQ